ncbi:MULTISPECIES: CopD family protein [unclassified Mycobacterium]|uniref:copper resistance D family protein n=1 Tax=unclassified Mycobacterium TaxID=2642494 RepID=UPI0007400C57|nr:MULTISPECIES: CopD family protein [unclassified Mycobacterium]KUH85905.1 copper resistance protein CopD [Mycobacterium sp. GA-1999]KUH91765.1 copper resistance protein CopD [Mycobacterium sp. GA-0227b]KUH96521.1 copper resistance protein CopD [Mycobacterium sp. IS-1556]
MTRRSAVAAGTLVAVAAAVLAWALAYPQASLSATAVRVLADCAGVVTLGLTVLPMLDGERHRGELLAKATRPLAVASAVWLLAELTRMLGAAAQAAAIPVSRLGVQTTVDFLTATAAGRTGVLAAAAAAVVCGTALVVRRSASSNVVMTGVAAVGIAARQLTGHFAESPLGGVAVTVHTLAAALWCGALAALLLTVEHRGQWARMLPRFSQLSLVCVLVLLIGGTVGAAVRMASPVELYATGYGRLLSAKIATTVVLVVLGWRNRTMWLPAARTHRASAVVSRTRARVETTLMIIALALAAGLAVAG